MRSLTLIAVLAAGCGLHKPYLRSDTDKPARQCSLPVLVGISEGMPEDLIPRIDSAIEYWNEAIGVNVFFNYNVLPLSADEKDAFTMIQLTPAEDLWDVYWATCGNTRVLINNATGCIKYADVKIADRCSGPPDIFETIVRHEIGHILGLSDNVDFTALMSHKIEPTMQHPVDANEEEIKAVRELYGLEQNGERSHEL